jgi:hypothetical protein
MSRLEREAEVIGRYLLGGEMPSDKIIELYISAHRHKPVLLNKKEEKVLRFLLDNRWAAGMIDGALAFSNPSGGIRRKILFMSAIIETQTTYADNFLPKERSFFYNIFIFWVGFRAVAKAVAGKILLLFI